MTEENKSLSVVPCESTHEIQDDSSIMKTDAERLKEFSKVKTEDKNELDDYEGVVK